MFPILLAIALVVGIDQAQLPRTLRAEVLDVRGDQVRLSIGSEHGAEKATSFILYRSEPSPFLLRQSPFLPRSSNAVLWSSSQVLAEVVLVEVGPKESAGRIVGTPRREVTKGDHAVWRRGMTLPMPAFPVSIRDQFPQIRGPLPGGAVIDLRPMEEPLIKAK